MRPGTAPATPWAGAPASSNLPTAAPKSRHTVVVALAGGRSSVRWRRRRPGGNAIGRCRLGRSTLHTPRNSSSLVIGPQYSFVIEQYLPHVFNASGRELVKEDKQAGAIRRHPAQAPVR